jgi:hypothetical protein
MSESNAPTREDVFNAVRNEYPDKSFVLGDRVFPVKDLSYDAYVEFMELSRPILTMLVDSLELKNQNGEVDVEFNPAGFDVEKLIKLAGNELPRMAWLCCKQSDPNISIQDVKKLARRPQTMVQVVLAQVKHNDLAREFADFFKQIVGQIQELVPAAAEVVAPVSMTTSA